MVAPDRSSAGFPTFEILEPRLRIVEASRTVSADSIDVSSLDRYLDAAQSNVRSARKAGRIGLREQVAPEPNFHPLPGRDLLRSKEG
jgi:hypothetical protein